MAKTTFVDGNPQQGVQGTIVTAEFLNLISNHKHDSQDKDGSAPGLAGEISAWPDPTPPIGALECDGAAVSRTTYAALFEVLGVKYGIGDGATTFNLPDFRGQFLRGWAHGAVLDPDRATRTDRGDGTTGDFVGTKQGDIFKAHKHEIIMMDALGGAVTYPAGSAINNSSPNSLPVQNTGGNETRPVNINVMWIIKY